MDRLTCRKASKAFPLPPAGASRPPRRSGRLAPWLLASGLALACAPAFATLSLVSQLQGWVNNRGGGNEAGPINGTFTGNDMEMRYNSRSCSGSLPAPTPRRYDLAGAGSAEAVLYSALVGRTDGGGNFKVALPSKVYAGSTATVGLSWSGLDAGRRYVGGVRLTDPNGDGAVTTVLSVTTDGIAPANNRAPERGALMAG